MSLSEFDDEVLERLAHVELPFVVAGGWPLSQVVPQARTKDLDVFVQRDPSGFLSELGVPADEIERLSPTVARAGRVEAIRFQPVAGELRGSVISSFDFGILQVGYLPELDSWIVTDLWREHAASGLIEFDPEENPFQRPVRAQNRVKKMMQKLGWEVGPEVLRFMRYRADAGFELTPPEGGEVFQRRLRRWSYASLQELQSWVQPTEGGARHPLELIQGV